MIGLDAYISGAEDDTDDVAFKLSYFGLTKRDASPSYYQLTAPFSEALMDAFSARPNGLVHVRKILSGVPTAWEFFNVDRLDSARGAFSQALSVSGYRQSTNTSPATVSVPLSLVGAADQDSQGRLLLDVVPWALALTPGDTLIHDGVYYTLVLATWQASPAQHTLKLNAELQT
jgi:hypothetical protein